MRVRPSSPERENRYTLFRIMRQGLGFSVGRIGVGGGLTTATEVPPPVATSNEVAAAASSSPATIMARNKRSIRENDARAGLVPAVTSIHAGHRAAAEHAFGHPPFKHRLEAACSKANMAHAAATPSPGNDRNPASLALHQAQG
ncbi:MAG: hypothetical protein ACREDY_20865, partial [Bradyrhizobium sp.]